MYDYLEFVLAPIRLSEREINFPKNSKILDVACGTGTQSILLARKGFSVVGVDLSPDMIARANKKARKEDNVTFICGDASKIEYSDSYFDLSLISLGLHEMPEEIGLTILKEMKRVTNKNGKIIIIDYHIPKNKILAFIVNRISKIWESKHYDHFLTVGLEYYLEKVGLKIEKKEERTLGNIQVVICANLK